MSQNPEYEIIIIGGSYAGLSAAMTLGRSLRSVLIIDAGKPCNRNSPLAHNFVGFDGEMPQAISAIAREQVLKYHTVTFMNARAKAVSGRDSDFEVVIDSGLAFRARKVLLATGVIDILPDIPGFNECWGKTVIHCPYCHGYELSGKKTAILAHGVAGFEMSRVFSQWTSDISLLTNDNEPFSFEELKQLQEKNISVLPKRVSGILHQDGKLKSVTFSDDSLADFEVLYARCGIRQSTTIPIDLGCELDSHGFVRVDEAQRTNIPGLFAAGDMTTSMRSLARAVAAGNTAGMSINHELTDEK